MQETERRTMDEIAAWNAGLAFVASAEKSWRGRGISAIDNEFGAKVSRMILKSDDESKIFFRSLARMSVKIAPSAEEPASSIVLVVAFNGNGALGGKGCHFAMGSEYACGGGKRKHHIESAICVEDGDHPLLGGDEERDTFMDGYFGSLKGFAGAEGIAVCPQGE